MSSIEDHPRLAGLQASAVLLHHDCGRLRSLKSISDTPPFTPRRLHLKRPPACAGKLANVPR